MSSAENPIRYPVTSLHRNCGSPIQRVYDSTIQRFNEAKLMIRSGIGYDIHRFADGLKLILGGVEIAHARGLEGHSDADVLSHAIADALLGAIGAGDIGQHFPNTDESIRGIRSIEILKRVAKLLAEKNARVLNVDATVIAEVPKLAPYGPAMRQQIAAAIGVTESEVSVKATTNEKLGPIGQGEGIAAIAIATVEILGSGD